MNILALLLAASPAHAYKAVIFDCDGVLVDSEHLKFLAWQQSLAHNGVDFQESDYLSLVGHSAEKIAALIQQQQNTHFDTKKVIAERNDIYNTLQKKGVPPLPDGVNFLKALIAKKESLGIKIAIASSAPQPEILENLKQIGVKAKDFDAILSGSDDLTHIQDVEGTNKPKPYIYQLTAEKLGVNPAECVVFEDSNAGVVAATKAGMSVIAVPNPYTKNHDFSLAIEITQFNKMDIYKVKD